MNFYTSIKDGKFDVSTSENIRKWIRHFEGENVVVSIELDIDTRTLRQNKLYWGVVLPQCLMFYKSLGIDRIPTKEHGVFFVETESDLHEIFKIMFLRKTVKKLDVNTGEIYHQEITGSTTQLNKSSFEEYLQKIAQFMAEIGCEIIF
jgi:hypothetical protein